MTACITTYTCVCVSLSLSLYYTYIYIYIHREREREIHNHMMPSGRPAPSEVQQDPVGSKNSSARSSKGAQEKSKANLHTNILEFRGFDSSIILMLRGQIPRPIGNLLESLSQAILVGIILVGRLGVEGTAPLGARKAPKSMGHCPDTNPNS